jgi:hypothetical protein
MNVEARCDACHHRSTNTQVEWKDGIALRLCEDFKACNKRSGVTR